MEAVEEKAKEHAIALNNSVVTEIDTLGDTPVLMQADPTHFLLSAALNIDSPENLTAGQEITGELSYGENQIPLTVSVAEIDSHGRATSLVLPDTVFDEDVSGTFLSDDGSLSAVLTTKYATGQQVLLGMLKYCVDSDPLVQASRVRGYIDQIMRAILPVNTSYIADSAVTGTKINNAAITAGVGISVTIDVNGNFVISAAATAVVQLHVTFNNKLINTSAVLSSQGLSDRMLNIVNSNTIFDVVKSTDYMLAFAVYDTANEITTRHKVANYTVNVVDNTAVITINLLTDSISELVSPVFDSNFIANFNAGSAAIKAFGDDIFTGLLYTSVKTTSLGTMPSYYTHNNQTRYNFVKLAETDTEVTGVKFPSSMPTSGTLCYLRFTMNKATHQLTSMSEIDTGIVPRNFSGNANWGGAASITHVAANKYVYITLGHNSTIAFLIDFDTNAATELFTYADVLSSIQATLGISGVPYTAYSLSTCYYDNNTLYTYLQVQETDGDNTYQFLRLTYNLTSSALTTSIIASIPFTSAKMIYAPGMAGNWDMALRDGKMIVASNYNYYNGNYLFFAIDLASNKWAISSVRMPSNSSQPYNSGFSSSIYKNINGKDCILVFGASIDAYEIDWDNHTASSITVASMLPNGSNYTSQQYSGGYYLGCGLFVVVTIDGSAERQIIDIVNGKIYAKNVQTFNYTEYTPVYLQNGEAILITRSGNNPIVYITPDTIDPAWAGLYIQDKTF